MKFKKRKRKIFGTLVVCVILLIAFRIYLPTIVLNYTNKTLANLPDYSGQISGVEICLFKGQYSILDLEIFKRGAEETPLLLAPKTDLSVQWSALKQMRIVGEIDTYNPEINLIFPEGDVDDKASQTGAEVDWTVPIKELMPLEINRFSIDNAMIHYNDPAQSPPVDIYLKDLDLVGTNFSNTTDSDENLPSKIEANCTSIGGGQMYMTMRINPLMQIPDLDYTFKFEGVDLKALNDFSEAYANIDFETGTLDMFSEMAIKDGNIRGYFKPVMNNVDLIDFSEDFNDPLKLIWEGLASVVIEVFENQGKDQFATKVPLTGSVKEMKTKIWPTLGAILKNAFVEAFKKQPDDTIDYDNEFSKDQEA